MSNNTNEKGLIQLAPLFEEQKKLAEAETLARLEANDASRKLNNYSFQESEKVRESLSKGASTGDPFQDQMFRIFGLDKPALDAMAEFNKLLLASKGQQMVVGFSYKERIRFGGPMDTSENDWATAYCKVLGILSGAGLQPVFDESNRITHLIIPFDRYVPKNMERQRAHHFEDFEGMEPIEGPYQLESGYVSAFLQAIVKKEVWSHTLTLIGSRESVNAHYLIASDVRNASGAEIGLHLDERVYVADEMAAVLSKATTTEQVQASDI